VTGLDEAASQVRVCSRPSTVTATVEERFAEFAELLGERNVVALGSGRRGFGSDALTVKGRIFAMVSHGRLVLKLPHDRVSALIERGDGLLFDAGKGKPMREWVVLTAKRSEQWLSLAEEACVFVGGSRSPREPRS
jgi:TfoX/Sxy family transcriptional regulator of competence genes